MQPASTKTSAPVAQWFAVLRGKALRAGCIQAQKCHTNQCPVGVASQDPRRARALDVVDKTERVFRYQQATVAQAQQMAASMGLAGCMS